VPRAHRLNYSFDGYRKPTGSHHEDELTVDPKVMEPFDPVPNQVPRKVAIDRKRKEYASYDIDVLLRQHGPTLTRHRLQPRQRKGLMA
jgi:hypothetical protein